MRVFYLVLAGALCACRSSLGEVRKGRPGGGAEPDAADTGDIADTGDTPEDSAADEPEDTGPDPDDDGSTPVGIDVSHWNGTIDWEDVAASGVRFSFAKVSEGTYYTADSYEEQDQGAADAGLLHGGYHFAIPDDSGGAEQASFFVDWGGGWTEDGATLPGVLDIEYNPYGETCYDLSPSEMAAWIADFTEEYKRITGRAALIYTTANWWDTCVGSSAFGATNPLWVAHYGAESPSIPDGWSTYSFWQYTSEGSVAGISGGTDVNLYHGTLTALRDYAAGD